MFDKNSNLVKEISLKQQEYLSYAQHAYMPSMDSVIVTISRPLQKLLVTNSNGETIFEKYFQQFVRTDSIDHALNAPMWLPLTYYNNSVYLLYDAFKKLQYTTTPEEYASIRNIANRQPRICKVDLSNPDAEPICFGKNTLSKMYDNDTIDEITNPPFFSIGNHYLFDIKSHCGKIAVFDLNTNKLFKILEIKHNNKVIGIKQYKFKSLEESNRIYEQNYHKWALDNVIWDKYRELYYVFFRGGVKQNYRVMMQIFDKNLDFKQEIEIKDRVSTLSMYAVKEGLLLRDDADKKNVTYKLYSIKENKK